MHLNIVDITLSERTEMSPRLPRALLPILNDGGGNLYCLDLESAGPRVVLWTHDDTESQEPSVEGTDFSTWLGERLRGSLH